ncbi:MAG TPA: regulatory protein RecX [Gemmatimonadales bacterium]|nr:regulatory protein RecX [Gemmatimonadales bacterium]
MTGPERITALEPDPRRPGCIRVYADGQPYCTVPESVAAGLALDRPLDPALLARLDAAADAEAAFRSVVRALERRAYARVDLGRRLVRRGHPREAVEAALDRAAAAGLVDDVRFTTHYVQTRAARGRGPARIARDLMLLGLARATIDRAIADEWPPDTDRAAMPRALAARRAGQLGGLPRPVLRRRLLAYLARRGFSGREALDAVREVAG